MRKICFILFFLIFNLFYGNLFAQSGPPSVKVTVTITNTCTWPIPVRLERSKYSIWYNDFGDTITHNGWVSLKPGESISYKIDKGVGHWFFFVENTTNGTYSYNISPRSFRKDTVIAVSWVDDEYSWPWPSLWE